MIGLFRQATTPRSSASQAWLGSEQVMIGTGNAVSRSATRSPSSPQPPRWNIAHDGPGTLPRDFLRQVGFLDPHDRMALQIAAYQAQHLPILVNDENRLCDPIEPFFHRVAGEEHGNRHVFAGNRQGEGEFGADSLLALRPDPAIVCLHEMLADRQPQAGAFSLTLECAIHLVEFLEKMGQLVCRDARACIGNADQHVALSTRDLNPDDAVLCEAGSISQQVEQDLADARPVNLQRGQVVGDHRLQTDVTSAEKVLTHLDGIAHQSRQFSRFPIEGEAGDLEA